MQTRNKSDRRNSDRRTQDLAVDINRRNSQRRSGFDRRAMLASEMA